jgi:hypothetical protein
MNMMWRGLVIDWKCETKLHITHECLDHCIGLCLLSGPYLDELAFRFDLETVAAGRDIVDSISLISFFQSLISSHSLP